MATRWGIAGSGKISHDFVTALATLPSAEHEVRAVAARSLERAQEFATCHNIQSVYGTYEELAKDENVEVVYVGTIHPYHYSVVKLMLTNGKNVLCEKPLTMNLSQTSELVTLAKEKQLFLMEAVWSRCFPAYDMLRRELDAGTIGEVLQVNCDLGAPIDSVDRLRIKELGGGTVLDLGVYCLQLALLVFGTESPKSIVASGHLNEENVDTSMGCVLTYNNGNTAVLSTSSRVWLPNEAHIIGTRGIIKVPSPFWCPTTLMTPDKSFDFILPSASKPLNFLNSVGLRYEAAEVRNCLKKGLLESPKITHAETLLLASLEDQIRSQIGVVYSQDL